MAAMPAPQSLTQKEAQLRTIANPATRAAKLYLMLMLQILLHLLTGFQNPPQEGSLLYQLLDGHDFDLPPALISPIRTNLFALLDRLLPPEDATADDTTTQRTQARPQPRAQHTAITAPAHPTPLTQPRHQNPPTHGPPKNPLNPHHLRTPKSFRYRN